MSSNTQNDTQNTAGFTTMDRVELVEAHPLHRDEVKANVGKKGYIHPGHTLDNSGEVLVKFDKNNADEEGNLLWINPKWLERLPDPEPITDPDRKDGELTPGCYRVTCPGSYPRFLSVQTDETVLVKSTVQSLHQEELTVQYMESWLRDRWQEQKIRCEDTPFDEAEYPSNC